MPSYLISKERLFLEYERNLKKASKGVFNWYVYEKKNKKYLKIFVDVYGVTYVYEQLVTDKDSISPEISLMLDSRMSILGENKEEEREFNIQFSSPIPYDGR